MKHILSFALLAAFASPVFAECTEVPDRSAEIAVIVQGMKTARDQPTAQGLSGQMWDIWLTAPDQIAQAILDDGVAMLRYGEYAGSRARLGDLVDYCPDYAEGYNQRAFAAFLMGDYAAALVDLDAAIALQPVHLGALTGKVLTLINLGRNDEAQVVLREALLINPWLSERSLLIGPMPAEL